VRLRAGLEAVEKTVLSLMKVQPKFVSCQGSIIVTSLTVFPANIRSPGVQHVIRHFTVLSLQAFCC
jgi:hypothetical protein